MKPILPSLRPISPGAHSRRTGVIQGSFVGGRPRVSMPATRPGTLQRSAVAPSSGHATPLPDGLASLGPNTPGQRLPETIQRKMESLFRADFSAVRVHVGPQAGSIGALAFTHGSDLYFAPGQYSPTTPHGQRLLGQQLTHVVQQRTGRARNPFGQGMAVVQDPLLKAEADRMGLRASQPTPAGLKGATTPHAGFGPILPKRPGASTPAAVRPTAPGPILPKRADAAPRPIRAASGAILPSRPSASTAPSPILPGRPVAQPRLALGAALDHGRRLVTTVAARVGGWVFGT
jgi:hypothetical protein